MRCKAIQALRCSIPSHRLKRNYATLISGCHRSIKPRPSPPLHMYTQPSPHHGFQSIECHNGPTFLTLQRFFSTQPNENRLRNEIPLSQTKASYYIKQIRPTMMAKASSGAAYCGLVV
mmetsp:Transcript_34296/g.83216  ORF Transcript_34296/g.83216 Transcript_34296/m.83216 type:complete len:118 (+) Transcript_34296:85-438(+)